MQDQEEEQPTLAPEDFRFLVTILRKNQEKEIRRVLREKVIRESANQQLLQSAESQADKDEIRQRQRLLEAKAEETVTLIKS